MNHFYDQRFVEGLIKVSSIGLEVKDRIVIKSIFKLASRLKEKFIAIDEDQYNTADLLFVNADSAESLKIWQKIKMQNHSITPIMISKYAQSIDSEVTIRRPILISRLIAALDGVIQKQMDHINLGSVETGSGIKILIVDDSFSVRKYMEQKLPSIHSDNMSMDFADSGQSAMEKVKAANYDLVFLDVVMPGVDGYKVCKWIKSVRPDTRIVMLTSKKSPFDKVRGSMSGCDAYLTKPPRDDKLKKCLEF